MIEHDSQHAGETDQGDLATEQAIALAAKLQAQLDQLQMQLAWSNRLNHLGMLTAALAHEMGNLLTPVRSYAELALKSQGNDQLTERALHAAVKGTAKVDHLIARVMELGSPEQAKAAGSCLIHEVVEETVASMQPTVKQHRVHVSVKVGPAEAKIDPLALEQVLINLMTNACKAMLISDGRRKLTIESSESNDCLTLLVKDTGPGIPIPIRRRLFEPFMTTTRHHAAPDEQDDGKSSVASQGRRQGSGLGLSICKQLIEAANGEIRLVDSERGACFEITLRQSKKA